MSSWSEDSRYRVYSRRADQAEGLRLEREQRQRERIETKRERVWWNDVWKSIGTTATAASARDDTRVHPDVFGAPVPVGSGDPADDLPLDWF